MDKNMIHIDDLIRQRLSGAEEEERAGAWLRMRELLDEKQPVRVAAVFNWKRVLSYAAGLLLLAAAGAGGYYAVNSSGNADDSATSVNKLDRNSNSMLPSGVDVAGTQSAGIGNAQDANAGNQQQSVKEIVKASANKPSSGMVASTGKDAALLTGKRHTLKTNINNQSPAPATTIKETNPIENKANSNNVAATESTAASNNAVAENTQPSGNVPATGMQTTNNVFAAGNNNTPTPKQKIAPELTNPRYKRQIKTIDSIEVISTKETSRRGIRKVDTIAKGMQATEKYVDAPELAAVTSSANNTVAKQVLPSATLMERNSEEAIRLMAQYTDDKANLHNNNNKNYNPRRFEEMVQNMKVDFGKVSFHPGLVAGISSSVGAYNMMGLQLGVSGTMDISDHWGMFAELKGIYRFGNGKSFINNYKTVDPNNASYLGNNTYSYPWDSVAHSFNISSSTSIELPIAVRYSANRLNAFAGVNGVYNFAVKVDEYSQNYSKTYITKSPSAQELTQQWGENTVIGYDAFKARFMLGYVVGAGYQVTPDIGVDFRATQPFMESNAGKKSSAIISKQLYRAPSFQLNFTYKFSNNKYKPRELNY